MFGKTKVAGLVAVAGVLGLGSASANADHYRRSCGTYVSYVPSYYYNAPVYSAPVVYSSPVVYAQPVVYSQPYAYPAPVRTVTYGHRPAYYPPVVYQRPYAPVHYGHGYYRPSGISVGFGYGSRHHRGGFSFHSR